MAWGGKGRVFKCQVIEFDNFAYIEGIKSNFPEKNVSTDAIAKVDNGQIIIIKVLALTEEIANEIKIH